MTRTFTWGFAALLVLASIAFVAPAGASPICTEGQSGCPAGDLACVEGKVCVIDPCYTTRCFALDVGAPQFPPECTATAVGADGATFLVVYTGPLCQHHAVAYECRPVYMGGGGSVLADLTWECAPLLTL